MNRSRTVRLAAVAVLFAALAAAGCGGGGPKIVPVQGQLKIVAAGGKALDAANIYIQFLPDVMAGGSGPTSTGTTGPGGEFTLKTPAGQDGAAVGSHRVLLADLNEERTPQGARIDPAKVLSRIPPKYTVTTTTAQVAVPENGGTVVVEVTHGSK